MRNLHSTQTANTDSSAVTQQLRCDTLCYRKSCNKNNRGYGRNRVQYHDTGHRNHLTAKMNTWKLTL